MTYSLSQIEQFFTSLWEDYIQITPQAHKIHQSLLAKKEDIQNDHVAFRTLNLSPISLKQLEPHFLNLGYTPFEEYNFTAKKLRAWSYTPPEDHLPRIFLSELLTEQLSAESQTILQHIAQQIDPQRTKQQDIFTAGLLWDKPNHADYQILAAESEYAAWLSTIGLRANHFTININALKHYTSVESVLQLVESLSLSINESGGRIKGTPEQLLEQGSTMADSISFTFADGSTHTIPSCYYEFAKRYPTPQGTLYQGFVAASADKIFESTDKT